MSRMHLPFIIRYFCPYLTYQYINNTVNISRSEIYQKLVILGLYEVKSGQYQVTQAFTVYYKLFQPYLTYQCLNKIVNTSRSEIYQKTRNSGLILG